MSSHLPKIKLLFAMVLLIPHMNALAQSSSSLSKMPYLNTRITIDAVPITLSGFLLRLSNKHLTLSCRGQISHQKLQLHLVNQPVYKIMESLAQLIPGSWVRGKDPNTYFFYETTTAINKEKTWWKLFNTAWEIGISKLRDDVLTALQNAPDFDHSGLNSEMTPIQVKTLLTDYKFYNHLPLYIQNELVRNINLFTYYKYPHISLFFTNIYPSALLPYSDFSSEEKSDMQHMISQSLPQLNLTVLNPLITFSLNNRLIMCSALLPNGNRQACAAELPLLPHVHTLTPEVIDGMKLNQVKLAADVNKNYKNSSFLYKELAYYQNQTVWPQPSKHYLQHKSDRFAPRRVDLLTRLANQSNMNFIADYYSLPQIPLTPSQMHKKIARTIPQELSRICHQDDSSWKKIGHSIYLIRNSRWYIDDKLEVNQSLLNKWVAMLPVQNMSPIDLLNKYKTEDEEDQTELDVEQEAWNKLTPFQISNGLRFYVHEGYFIGTKSTANFVERPFASLSTIIGTQYPLLNFMKTLSPAQFSQLRHGSLSVKTLIPVQVKAAEFCCPQLYYILQDPKIAANMMLHLMPLPISAPDGLPNVGYQTITNGVFPSDLLLLLPTDINNLNRSVNQ